ncbi:16642_t:CDS:2 [Funneliformis caledonium]|uniref:16642_t:CDS:1 n=1 Tax=Funneliformis caledonium TaxID=1117310 RepID=A0A9N9E6F5_9GLOM|nr:16642_t:CDS:2 [Funneliformis caledonium]
MDCGCSSTTQGLVLSAFFVGYLTTQILGGALADKFGGKPVLAIERSRANAVVTGSSVIGAVVGLPHGRLGSGIKLPDLYEGISQEEEGVRDLHSNAGMNQLLYLANIPWMSILSKKEITLALTSRNWDILLSFAGTIGDHMIHKVKFRVITIRRIAQSIGSFGVGDKLTIGMGLNAFTLGGRSVNQFDIAPKICIIYGLGNTLGVIPGYLYFSSALIFLAWAGGEVIID